MRFSLVDRIIELEPGVSIKAVKNLSLAEEYLQDHFPGFPVMPGVLMVESLVQTGAWLMRHAEDFAYSTVLLKEIKAVRFNNFVAPGKRLEITCRLVKNTDREYTFKSSGTVDGGSAVSARIILQQFNLAERNQEMQQVDERRIAQLRQEFDTLWSSGQ